MPEFLISDNSLQIFDLQQFNNIQAVISLSKIKISKAIHNV